MPAAYPMLLDVTTLRVVVVGGGNVAARKVRGLIEAGATDVTVVAPALADDMPAGVRHVEAAYSSETLADARLVFAATNDPVVNAAIVADARAAGVLACRADAAEDGGFGDFTTPAAFRDGAVVVTVSTGSAALTAAVRDGLRDRFDPRWATMADAMATLRPMVKDRVPAGERAGVLRRLASDEAFAVLDRGGIAGLVAWVEDWLSRERK